MRLPTATFDVNNIDDWWMARFMQDRKHKIENDVPFIEFDFEVSIHVSIRGNHDVPLFQTKH